LHQQACTEKASRFHSESIKTASLGPKPRRAGAPAGEGFLDLPLEFADPHAPAAAPAPAPKDHRGSELAGQLAEFNEFGKETRRLSTKTATFEGAPLEVPAYVNEFWTARQRQANRLHEISYRACFKPQLPRFFVERLTEPGEVVYDPFMGRGTTLIEAGLLGRVPAGCDVNPLSVTLVRPRLNPPEQSAVQARLQSIPFEGHEPMPEDLLVFYHPETLRQIGCLRRYLLERRRSGALDAVDDWITCVALNRLTGHSAGFFSVYTMPPNQAVSAASQRKINERRKQTPPVRDVRAVILKKSRGLLSECTPAVRRQFGTVSPQAIFLTASAQSTPQLASDSVSLVVTSPPFLDVVQYATDNWLRCWFLDIDPKSVQLTVPKRLEAWQETMSAVFRELHRVLKPGGHVAFEVGEVHGGKTKLEEAVLPCGVAAGLEPLLVVINDQEFTKTANCWGVDNMNRGTNTNRIVVFRKRP
jgi:hypothetical protein